MAADNFDNKTINLMVGILLLNMKIDELKAGARKTLDAIENGEKVDSAMAPEIVYMIGASDMLNALCKCTDDPFDGVKAFEKNVSDLRFHAQLATMGEES